ncbi:MAG: hypothetical protein U0822_24720 [Anaerolineae bacterium]
MAGGDARTALNALELAVESTPPDDQGVIHIDDTVAEESIQRRVVRYNRRGRRPPLTPSEATSTTAGAYRPRPPADIFAFIKSVRGSDPDAVLY